MSQSEAAPAGAAVVVDPVAAHQARVSEIAARAEATREQLAAVRPSVTSADGAVTVTVTSAGALDGLRFGDAAAALPLPELAGLVLRTAQRARVQAAEQTRAALAGLVGENSPALDYVTREIPSPEDDDVPPAADGVAHRDVPHAEVPPPDVPPRDLPPREVPTRGPAPELDDEDGFTGRGTR